MKIQRIIDFPSQKEEAVFFMKNWEELTYKLTEEPYEGKLILTLEIPDEDFEKLTEIFSSPRDAMGAFLTTAQEHGWELIPTEYAVYHAEYDGNRVIAGLKTPEGISVHDQLHLEELIRKMASFPRIVTYSGEVLTFIKDLFPEADSRAFIIAREISRKGIRAPDLEDLGRIYGIDTSTIEGKLNLIDSLLENPIRTPEGEVFIKPFYLPLSQEP
jgi:hypothetical protein